MQYLEKVVKSKTTSIELRVLLTKISCLPRSWYEQRFRKFSQTSSTPIKFSHKVYRWGMFILSRTSTLRKISDKIIDSKNYSSQLTLLVEK